MQEGKWSRNLPAAVSIVRHSATNSRHLSNAPAVLTFWRRSRMRAIVCCTCSRSCSCLASSSQSAFARRCDKTSSRHACRNIDWMVAEEQELKVRATRRNCLCWRTRSCQACGAAARRRCEGVSVLKRRCNDGDADLEGRPDP